MDSATLESFRYCFQRILIPCFVFIGIFANAINVVVLTRRRMRCSTNLYLTALAVSDIIYLLCVLLLSFRHYPNITYAKYELYWRTFGLMHWISDAANYISIYITVSFTIERYIAVCHPIRGQVLCTESKAKKVIAIVVVLCLLCTCSTAFEYQLDDTKKYIDRRTGITCDEIPPTTAAAPNNTDTKPSSQVSLSWMPEPRHPAESAIAKIMVTNENGTLTLTQEVPPIEDLGSGGGSSSSSSEFPTYARDNTSRNVNNNSNSNNTNKNSSIEKMDGTSNPDKDYIYDYYQGYNVAAYVQADSPQYTSNPKDFHTAEGEDGKTIRRIREQKENLGGDTKRFTSTKDRNFENAGIGDVQRIHDGHSKKSDGNRKNETLSELSSSLRNDLNESATLSGIIGNKTDNCYWQMFLNVKPSTLMDNMIYVKGFFLFTTVVFTFIPLIMLMIFNCFLIAAVRRSNRLRRTMTNHTNSRQIKHKIKSISQENRITVILIAVVIMFIICQTPSAIFLLTSDTKSETVEMDNLKKAVGNVFNFLIMVNAASNFVLYCALSDKYRLTIKQVLFGKKNIRQNTMNNSYQLRKGTLSNSYRTPINQKSNSLRYERAPQSTNVLKNPTTRNSFHSYNIQRPSLTPSEDHLKVSSSSQSLTRSQSLIFRAKTKHSPDCKEYRDVL